MTIDLIDVFPIGPGHIHNHLTAQARRFEH